MRWIPRELLVGQVRVVLELSGWLDHVDTPLAIPARKLSAPDRSVESCCEVDVVHHSAGFEVRFPPGNQEIAHREVCLRTVQVHARFVHLERHRLTQAVHAAKLAVTQATSRIRASLVLTPGQQRARIRHKRWDADLTARPVVPVDDGGERIETDVLGECDAEGKLPGADGEDTPGFVKCE